MGGGTRDLALKSHNSRRVLAGGILYHLPQLNSPSLFSGSLCLALVCLSFLSLFHLSSSVPLSLVYLCSFFTVSLLLPGFHYLFLCPRGVCFSYYPFIFLAINILYPLPWPAHFFPLILSAKKCSASRESKFKIKLLTTFYYAFTQCQALT